MGKLFHLNQRNNKKSLQIPGILQLSFDRSLRSV